MLFQKPQCLRRSGGDGDEMIRRSEAQLPSERFEIRNQHVIGEFLPHFFRKPGAALVVAQHAIASGKARRDRVPGMKRAAKLVQQHHGWPARAGKLVMQAHAIGVHERHGSLL